MATEWQQKLIDDGYYLWPSALPLSTITKLVTAIERMDLTGKAGMRRPELKDPEFLEIAHSEIARTITGAALGTGARPVRMILFDKTPEANWHVAWHQDPCIAVKSKAEVAGYTGWSEKGGVNHVQPPAGVLENMVTLRIHLDETPASNGALEVVPGSHRIGRIPEKQIQGFVAEHPKVVCEARPGDILIMKPLILHSSRKSVTSGHRRVIHIEYAGSDLPRPLEWLGIA